MNDTIPLEQALRALPLEAPAQSLWPALQAHRPKRPVRPIWPLAAAASAALLAVLLQFRGAPGGGAPANPASGAAPSEITRLMDRSAQLENIFYAAQDDARSSATVIASNLGIEEQLAAIDTQLAGQPDTADALVLWRQRVALLDQGVALNNANAAYRAEGGGFDLALASLN